MTNEKIQDRITLILETARRDHDDALTSLKAYTERLEAATDEMNKATAASDLQAYSVATAKVADAQRAVDLFTRRRDTLENDPLLPDDEYRELLANTMANFKDVEERTKTRLSEIREELAAMRSTLMNAACDTNGILHDLQYSVNRKADLKYLRNGKLDDHSVRTAYDHDYQLLCSLAGWMETFPGNGEVFDAPHHVEGR